MFLLATNAFAQYGGNGAWGGVRAPRYQRVYTDVLYLGYNGTTSKITTDDTNENLTIDPNGTGLTYILDARADSSFTTSHGTAWDMADSTYTGETFIMKADANTIFGNVCFINTDSEMVLSQGDAAGKPGLYMCVERNGVKANAYGTFLISGMVKFSPWTTLDTAGAFAYVDDDTAGLPTITQPPDVGDFYNKIGVVIETDVLHFNPDLSVAGL